ncbi:prepilin-type N-terminal cleavage/methylation domain-containing protein [Clostridium sp. Marseille-P299]|uniref:prepilin-type N-terminal cleavage/methylation domain-containing protein n=1 Tax=Clostridium sp. Marseille-P299 TaxID=1805477 RepID=UPI000832AD1D|nr:prepilin-type N-terminal cleavage/methylation domain-containing protein [Clostridium sp. Marseille-P299]
MRRKDEKVKKLNNKGFSLVEIIIVIAIIAILAGALAPQLMKYVGKSRESADINNCNSIRTAVQTALADEKAYDSITGNISFIFNGKEPDKNINGGDIPADFLTELSTIIKDWPQVKVKGKTGFQVNIDGEKSVNVETVSTPTPTPGA